jgi:transcriptional regulator with XRE-family HTH domain
MPSFQISIEPNRRAAARFVGQVRRALQKALMEEKKKSGMTQADIARALSVNRSVINKELKGFKDMTLGRVAELAWALGRRPLFELPLRNVASNTNQALPQPQATPLPSSPTPIPPPEGFQMPPFPLAA